MEKGARVNVRTTRTATRRDRHSYETRKGGRCVTEVVSRRFQLQETRAGVARGKREKRGTSTYVDVPLNVPNQDEVTRTGVADVGVNGDRASRVSLNKVGQV